MQRHVRLPCSSANFPAGQRVHCDVEVAPSIKLKSIQPLTRKNRIWFPVLKKKERKMTHRNLHTSQQGIVSIHRAIFLSLGCGIGRKDMGYTQALLVLQCLCKRSGGEQSAHGMMYIHAVIKI
jgi:hypothetical protein